MKSRLRELEIKKLMKEYDYLLLDGEYKKEFIENHSQSFMETIAQMREKMGVKEKETEAEKKTEENKGKSEPAFKIDVNKDTEAKIKSIYRSIVKITHPDKADGDKYAEIYINATKYYEENNILELYLICIDLNIDVDITDIDTEDIGKIIDIKKKQLEGLEHSYLWLWVNATTEEAKELIVKSFIEING